MRGFLRTKVGLLNQQLLQEPQLLTNKNSSVPGISCTTEPQTLPVSCYCPVYQLLLESLYYRPGFSITDQGRCERFCHLWRRVSPGPKDFSPRSGQGHTLVSGPVVDLAPPSRPLLPPPSPNLDPLPLSPRARVPSRCPATPLEDLPVTPPTGIFLMMLSHWEKYNYTLQTGNISIALAMRGFQGSAWRVHGVTVCAD